MKSLPEAYRLCFGDPAACPVHRLLASENASSRASAGLQEAGAV